MNVKILLLQARHVDDTARLEERLSFASAAGIAEEKVIPYDLLTQTPSLAFVRQFDALMLGGSGDYYVSKGNLPNFQTVLDLLAGVVATGHPTFASCFGFQLMVKALGGEILYDPDHTEVGTYLLTLTEAGRADELFGFLPLIFRAQLGRKDRAGRLPEGLLNLASSLNAPYQSFRVPGKPIWATQFHPELTKETNLERFHRYMEGYAPVLSARAVQETLDRFDDSPEANQLIRRFIETVFGK